MGFIASTELTCGSALTYLTTGTIVVGLLSLNITVTINHRINNDDRCDVTNKKAISDESVAHSLGGHDDVTLDVLGAHHFHAWMIDASIFRSFRVATAI